MGRREGSNGVDRIIAPVSQYSKTCFLSPPPPLTPQPLVRAFIFSVELITKELLVLWGLDRKAAVTVLGNSAQVLQVFFSWQFGSKYSYLPRGIKGTAVLVLLLVLLLSEAVLQKKLHTKRRFVKHSGLPVVSFFLRKFFFCLSLL